MTTARHATLVIITAAAALAALQAPRAQTLRTPELPHVRSLGAALQEYNDGDMHAVAAFYHSQRHHDGPWVLIELAITTRYRARLTRDRMELQAPDGHVIPLSGQGRWARDARHANALLQQVTPTRHRLRSYFTNIGDLVPLRFFTPPGSPTTVVDEADSADDVVLMGDLLFESPTGAWETGTYVLAIGYERGVAQLPIALR